jgi:hypothetical protein
MRSAALALLLAAAGCASALKEPRSLDILAPGSGKEGAAQELLESAQRSWAQRPDVEAVRRAAQLYWQAAGADHAAVEGLVGAIRAQVWLVEHEKDSARRTELAVSSVEAGQWCQRRVPHSATCDFWLAVALGIQAREKRLTADDALKRMVELLRRAAAADPALDEAGPNRVLALVLLRAPSWPLGPGDVEAALDSARRAAGLRPDYPPNQQALGEALRANGQDGAAAFTRALTEARRLAASGDPDAPEWAKESEAALRRK